MIIINLRLETPVNADLEDLRVCVLYMLNSLGWDVEMLEELFLPRDVKKICNLPHRSGNLKEKNCLAWKSSWSLYS